jgi:hypothetical protein
LDGARSDDIFKKAALGALGGFLGQDHQRSFTPNRTIQNELPRHSALVRAGGTREQDDFALYDRAAQIVEEQVVGKLNSFVPRQGNIDQQSGNKRR